MVYFGTKMISRAMAQWMYATRKTSTVGNRFIRARLSRQKVRRGLGGVTGGLERRWKGKRGWKAS